MEIVALAVSDDVNLDARPVARVDGCAAGREVQCDLDETAIVLETHISLHADRLASLNFLAPHRAFRDAAHHAVGDQLP